MWEEVSIDLHTGRLSHIRNGISDAMAESTWIAWSKPASYLIPMGEYSLGWFAIININHRKSGVLYIQRRVT